MKAAVDIGQAAFLTRPLRRPPRPYHAGGAVDGVAAGRGGVSLPRPRRARCSASLSVGAGGYGGACCLGGEEMIYYQQEDGCYMGEERLERGWVLHGLKSRQHQACIVTHSRIYFLNDKMKNLVRASTTGLGVFVSGWIVGSLLVPVIPTFAVPPTWSLELLTSLVAYVFLFLGCTFLK